MLFHIQKEKSSGRVVIISLNENILKNGVMEINRINYIARNQLMKYYTNCEEKYMDGMKIVIDSKSREKEASQPPAPPAPPASNKFERVSTFISAFPTPASRASVAAARAKGLIPPVTAPSVRAAPSAPSSKGVLPTKYVRFQT